MTLETFEVKNFEISSLNDFLKAIIKDKTILEYKNIYGNDAYILASMGGELEIMKYLENEHNWDIYTRNNNRNDAYDFGNSEIRKHLDELYKKEKEEKDSNLEEQLKLEKEKNSKLEDELKQIKETLKKFLS